MAAMEGRAGPLDGIRVIDFTNVVAGPYAAMILADQGADVIKIEGPRRRDFARGAGEGASQLNSVFLNNNRNKRSLSVDATTDAGREILLRLAATADVFVQNYRPGVMTRLGHRRAVPPGGEREDRLRLDERIRRVRSVRAQAGLRPAHPGAVRD